MRFWTQITVWLAAAFLLCSFGEVRTLTEVPESVYSDAHAEQILCCMHHNSDADSVRIPVLFSSLGTSVPTGTPAKNLAVRRYPQMQSSPSGRITSSYRSVRYMDPKDCVSFIYLLCIMRI